MTTYAMPDPPPAAVTTLWDTDGDQWVLGPDGWFDPDHPPAWDDRCLTIDELFEEYGPLSDTAPKETP
jgi:hypothetical protein